MFTRKCVWLVAAALVCCAVGSVQATVVTLTGGDSTDGWVAPSSPLLAYNLGASGVVTDETIQGVTFKAWPGTTTAPNPPSGVTVTSNLLGTSKYDMSATPLPYQNGTANDQAMATMIDTLFYNYSNSGVGPLTFTIGGLTAGGSYQVDLFLMSQTTRAGEVFTFNDGTVESFTATAATSYLIRDTVTAVGGQIVLGCTNTGGLTPLLDGFVVSTVPEPTSMVLLVTGLIGLLAYAWRKRK